MLFAYKHFCELTNSTLAVTWWQQPRALLWLTWLHFDDILSRLEDVDDVETRPVARLRLHLDVDLHHATALYTLARQVLGRVKLVVGIHVTNITWCDWSHTEDNTRLSCIQHSQISWYFTLMQEKSNCCLYMYSIIITRISEQSVHVRGFYSDMMSYFGKHCSEGWRGRHRFFITTASWYITTVSMYALRWRPAGRSCALTSWWRAAARAGVAASSAARWCPCAEWSDSETRRRCCRPANTQCRFATHFFSHYSTLPTFVLIWRIRHRYDICKRACKIKRC